ARVVWIPKAIVHNPPQSGNVVVAWAKAAEEIPVCALKLEALRRIRESVATDKGIAKAFAEAFREGSDDARVGASPTQEQEAVTGTQEQDSPQSPPGGCPGFEEFWSLFPRKESKDKARKTWNKLRPDGALQTVIGDAIRAQVTWPKWT